MVSRAMGGHFLIGHLWFTVAVRILTQGLSTLTEWLHLTEK